MISTQAFAGAWRKTRPIHDNPILSAPDSSSENQVPTGWAVEPHPVPVRVAVDGLQEFSMRLTSAFIWASLVPRAPNSGISSLCSEMADGEGKGAAEAPTGNSN